MIRHALEKGVSFDSNTDLSCLTDASELTLMKKLVYFPKLVIGAKDSLETQRIPVYLQELAANFHQFYHNCRIVSEDKTLSSARLALAHATKVIVAGALNLMGVSAPEKM